MLKSVDKATPEIIMPEGNVLVIHHGLMPVDPPSGNSIDYKRNIDKVKMDVVFQQTLMPEQRINFIKPKKHDFL